MAAMNIATPTNAGAVAAFAATAVAGDSVKWRGGCMLVEFRNTHTAAITVSVAPVITTSLARGAGAVTTPTRTISVAASSDAVFRFTEADVAAYVDASGNINFTYASGNVALLYRALKVL